MMQVTGEMTDKKSGKTTSFTCTASSDDFDKPIGTTPLLRTYVTTESYTGDAKLKESTNANQVTVATKYMTVPEDA